MSMTHMTREQVKEHERIICKRAIALFRCAPESRSGDADGMSVDIMTAADGLRGHALATLDALDAALEALRYYADESNYNDRGVVGDSEYFAPGMSYRKPDNGDRARAALAAVATPQGQEVTCEDR